MAKHDTIEELFTATADAIRGKENSTAKIVADDFPDRITALQNGIDSSDATATAADIKQNKTAYVNSGKITGTLVESSGENFTTDNYETDDITKSVTLVATGSSSPKIINENTEIRTSISRQLLGNAVSNDVVSGKTFSSIAGVSIIGTLDFVDTTDATASASDIASGKTAYVNGSKITGNMDTLSSVTLVNGTYSNNSDSIIFSGKPSSPGYITYATSASIDVLLNTFGNATAADVATGKTFTSAAGFQTTGSYTPTRQRYNLNSSDLWFDSSGKDNAGNRLVIQLHHNFSQIAHIYLCNGNSFAALRIVPVSETEAEGKFLNNTTLAPIFYSGSATSEIYIDSLTDEAREQILVSEDALDSYFAKATLTGSTTIYGYYYYFE